MFSLIIIGTVLEIAHHLFYNHLDGKEAESQAIVLRCGTDYSLFKDKFNYSLEFLSRSY